VCVGLGNQSITEFVVSLKTLFLLNEIRVERRRLKKKSPWGSPWAAGISSSSTKFALQTLFK